MTDRRTDAGDCNIPIVFFYLVFSVKGPMNRKYFSFKFLLIEKTPFKLFEISNIIFFIYFNLFK